MMKHSSDIYYSQIMQDKIALKLLKHKRNGTFLDIGCSYPMKHSNTAAMELHYGWHGIGVDIDCSVTEEWKSKRPNTVFVCKNALEIDWNALLEENGMPKEIDFLSVDLEPPPVTWHVLLNIPFDKYRFGVIAFEHDDYRNWGVKEPSRKFFQERGYVLASKKGMVVHNSIGGMVGVNIHTQWKWTERQDDIWIHSSIAEGMKLPLDRV
jgi:hypothetical protein